MNKKKTIIVGIIFFVLGIIIGITAFNVYDKIIGKDKDVVSNNEAKENKNNDIDEEDKNTSLDDTADNDVATEVVDKIISYSGEYIEINKYVEEFNSDGNYKNKLLNLTVNNVILNGKEYIFKFNKHPQNCLDNVLYYEEGHNEFYINDKKIYAQNNQACYLEMVHLITVIDEKYIGISFKSQGGNYMKIYNSNVELVDTLEFISVRVENGEVIYTEYQEGNGCLMNQYLYTIVDGKPVKTFKEQVSNTTCNQMTGEGCCNN